jgi:metallo-beta-lactamase class B
MRFQISDCRFQIGDEERKARKGRKAVSCFAVFAAFAFFTVAQPPSVLRAFGEPRRSESGGGAFRPAVTAAPQDTPDAHRAAAKAAAGREFAGLYSRVCLEPAAPASTTTAQRGQRGQPPAERQIPPRNRWYTEPVKVFDNLYFLGTKEHGSWAVATTDGIILLDALFDYAVDSEVAEGLQKLGLDPQKIKYAIMSHGHGDHDGGAKYLQDRFKARIIMGEPDWELTSRNSRDPVPQKDLVATDGQKVTLGGQTVTLYLTPGHTAGTVSTLIPVTDGGRPHVAAEWGGTAFSATTPAEQLRTYIGSAQRFRDVASRAGADVIITNHTAFDGTLAKLDALKSRKPGAPHPYVLGTEGVKRYLTVAEECAKAALAAKP